MISQLLSIHQTHSKDNEKMREILNKWVVREEVMIEICIEIINKEYDDHRVEKN